MEKKIDIHRILQILPHRYPFILVDRIIDVVPGERITGLKNVTINEPFFQGHFPGRPIMPGVLIIEAMAQAGGVLVMDSRPEMLGTPIYFMGMDKVRFRKPVVPGDQLVLEIHILKFRKKVVRMSGVAMVNEERAAEAEMLAAFGEET